MIIKLNTEHVIDNNINPNYFIISYLWNNDCQKEATKLYNNLEINIPIQEILKLCKDLTKEYEDQDFKELISVYPKETPVGRKLHGDIAYCEKVYKFLTKDSIGLHEHIIKCLKQEKIHRAMRGQLNFWLELKRWITQEGWTQYEGELEIKITKNSNNKLLT